MAQRHQLQKNILMSSRSAFFFTCIFTSLVFHLPPSCLCDFAPFSDVFLFRM
jgi:hypothetical protein